MQPITVIALVMTVLLIAVGMDILRFIRAAKRSKMPHTQTVTILPVQASCCGGALTFSVPMDFHLESRTEINAVFVGNGNIRLTVMQLPAAGIRIRTLSGSELHRYFAEALAMRSIPQVTHGHLDRAPTLTAWWDSEPQGTTAYLHLIEVPEAVFLMVLSGLSLEQQSLAEPIFLTASVQRDRIRGGR